MFEINGDDPSFTLIAPAEHDIGRNTYRIIDNEGHYHRGILSIKSIRLGLRTGFNPKDPETGDPILSLLGFQDSLPEENLQKIFEEILRLNEQVRKGLGEIFTDENVNIPSVNGPYWWHALRLPKTELMDNNPEFDELEGDTLKKSLIRVYQEPRSTLLKIAEPSYTRLHEKTKAKIEKALTLLN